MNSTQSTLQEYLERTKFADPDRWLQRGLNPSPPPVVASMETVVNEVCSAALTGHKLGATETQLAAAMKAALNRWKAHDFDTEEREFLCSEVEAIGKIAGVRIAPVLNRWMYGPILGRWLNLRR